ncbi:hypothetical protein GBAR_LOCUS8536 [Geodia barretti]|nr:hypothetical protein GBAR_LOCUS8536 [Geodia barretti]
MRVVSKHKHDDTDADAYDQKYVDALPEPMNPVAAPATIAGVPAKMYTSHAPSEEMKKQQQKPQPAIEKQHSPMKQQMRINQPRRS